MELHARPCGFHIYIQYSTVEYSTVTIQAIIYSIAHYIRLTYNMQASPKIIPALEGISYWNVNNCLKIKGHLYWGGT